MRNHNGTQPKLFQTHEKTVQTQYKELISVILPLHTSVASEFVNCEQYMVVYPIMTSDQLGPLIALRIFSDNASAVYGKSLRDPLYVFM